MVSVVPELTSTVWPSGWARATASAPTTVAAPGRFSTSTGWPRPGAMRSASSRAMTSVEPPGGNGTTNVTGRSGNAFCCATAGAAKPRPAMPAESKARRPGRDVAAMAAVLPSFSRTVAWRAGAGKAGPEAPRLTRGFARGDIRAPGSRTEEHSAMSLLASLEGRLSLPAIAAPLFIISVPDLVVAQCTAGVVGSMPSLNARPAEQFEEWVIDIQERLAAHDTRHPERPAAPFAINLIVHRSNDRLEHDLQICVKHRVPIIITSLGARPEVNEAVHSYGGHVLHDVINQKFARKAVEKGADGLVLVAAGAGGHAGSLSPFALVRETRAWFDGPLALSGAISHGASILAAEAMGADFGYVGSAFIATTEAR